MKGEKLGARRYLHWKREAKQEGIPGRFIFAQKSSKSQPRKEEKILDKHWMPWFTAASVVP